ncbi:unnamed protein product [Pylaiella littoralis]
MAPAQLFISHGAAHTYIRRTRHQRDLLLQLLPLLGERLRRRHMSAISKAEGQRKLSQILSAKRKEDPRGLLLAQRNGTLNEFLREDLAKHGLAVAGGAVPNPKKPSGASTGGEGGGGKGGGGGGGGGGGTAASASLSSSAAAAAVSKVASNSSQRHSYKAPSSTKLTSPAGGQATGAAQDTGGPRGCLASLSSSPTTSVSRPAVGSLPLPPPPSSQQQQRQPRPQQRDQAPEVEAGGKPTPGKLGASRFGSFSNSNNSSAPPPAAAAAAASAGGVCQPAASAAETAKTSAAVRSGSPRRWTVGPVSSPPSNNLKDKKAVTQRQGEAAGGGSASAAVTSSAAATSSAAPSVQGLTSRFGGLSAGSGSGYGGGGGGVGGGKRSTSGKIAELTRKFEK